MTEAVIPTGIPSVGEVLHGDAGNIRARTELWVSNKAGEYIARIPGTNDISVSMDNKRDWTWETQFTLPQTDVFDPLNDYVKLAMDLWAGNEWQRFGLGLYRLQVPSEEWLAWHRTWTLSAYSVEWVLLSHARRQTIDPRIQGYHVPPGSKVLAEARKILVDIFGFPGRRVLFPPAEEDVTLVQGMLFDVVQNPEGAHWLSIVNALLTAGGFYPLYTNGEGQLLTRKMRALNEEAPALRLGQGSRGAGWENLVHGDEPFRLARDWSNFANEVIVVSNDVNQIPPVAAIVTATNPANPYSTTQLGYTRSTTVQLQQAVGPAEARAIGRAELSKRIGAQEEWAFQTVMDPRRGPHEVYRMRYDTREGERILRGNYFVQGVGMQVKPFGLADHRVAKVLPLEEGDQAPQAA